MPEELDKQKRTKKLEKDEKEREDETVEEVVRRATPDEVKRKERKAQKEGEKVEKPIEEEAKEEKTAAEEKEEPDTSKSKTTERKPVRRGYMPAVGAEAEALIDWKPRTALGKKVLSGDVTDIDQILDSGKKIMESEIVDKLIPDLKSEMILIGGRRGKGGGIKRIPIQITATMHRSGRRFKYNAFAVVGNENGLIGIGKGASKETRASTQKAVDKAKLNIIRIKRGCGSWECGCGGDHSIPYKTEGKSGSVRVVLMPAPKGLGLVADDESKKILRLAGIKDVWMKTYGNTSMRINLINALFKALKGLHAYDR